jgi:hypothetical protein
VASEEAEADSEIVEEEAVSETEVDSEEAVEAVFQEEDLKEVASAEVAEVVADQESE